MLLELIRGITMELGVLIAFLQHKFSLAELNVLVRLETIATQERLAMLMQTRQQAIKET